EMRFHVESRAADNVDRGLLPAAARQAVERRFGNDVAIRELAREQRSFVWLEQVRRDVHYALRQIAQAPRLAAVVIPALGLGIGANTAIFTVLDRLLWRAMPVNDPARLVFIHGIGDALVQELAEHARTLTGVAAMGEWPRSLVASDFGAQESEAVHAPE